jgi:hypothetical protein
MGNTSVAYLGLFDGNVGCVFCETKADLTRDHIWPLSKGGCNCVGNSQVLCGKCNRGKSNQHDGVSGHQKDVCPEAKLRSFKGKWDRAREKAQRKGKPGCVEALIPELEAIRDELAELYCSPMAISKAHMLVGSIKAYVRDFDKLRAKQPSLTLHNLKQKEAGLITKLQEVREEIARQEIVGQPANPK